jgi:hypothetical protein
MDDNDCTTAFPDYGSVESNLAAYLLAHKSYRKNGAIFHALCDEGGTPKTVEALAWTNIVYSDGGSKAREQILFNLAALRPIPWPGASASLKDRVAALLEFGQYLHAKQDFYAHRQWPNCEDDSKYLPYGTKWGHVADGDKHTADYVAARPKLAKIMASTCYREICMYFFGKNKVYDAVRVNSAIDRLSELYPRVSGKGLALGGTTELTNLSGSPEQDMVAKVLSNNGANIVVPPFKPRSDDETDDIVIPYDDVDWPLLVIDDRLDSFIEKYALK